MTPKQFRLFLEMLESIRLTIQQRGDMTSYNCGPLSKADEMSYQVLEEASKMEEEAIETAAPDLLKACKLIARKMYDDSVGRTAVKAARAAIAKIEGREP